MIHERIAIQEEGSLPDAAVVTYLWGHSEEIPIEKRPLILICPGGGYQMTSDREAEAVALKLMSMGFHTAILRYAVSPARFPTALLETARAVCLFREHAKEWHIDSERIVLMGFSAGGHLAAGYGVFWNKPFLTEKMKCEQELLRPNALLLGYPVITAEEAYRHEGSFRELLGEAFGQEMLELLSLEKQVGPQTPKTFLWNTFADTTVPPENALLWVQALLKHKIPVEYHLYEKGVHGLSLANELTRDREGECYQKECQSWIRLAETWLKNI